MELTNLEYVQLHIGYEFKNIGLLVQAFTRKSFTEENKYALNNEVLEFYGDRALDFVIMKKMSEYYGGIVDGNLYASTMDEGELTEIKKKLVCREMLAEKIRKLDFHKRLILGKSDIIQKVWEQESVQEDLFEAILGAVAIDSKWNTELLTKVVDRMLNPIFYFENGFDDEIDYVKLVHQFYQKKYKDTPGYTFNNLQVMPTPYDIIKINLNDKVVCVLIDDILFNKTIRASGANKKEALRNAAKEIYIMLEQRNLLYSLVDEIGKPNIERAINQLQELYQKGYISEPQYRFSENHDLNGNPIWECECYLESLKQGFIVCDSSKKNAKKKAAYEMVWLYLGEDDNNDENKA